MLSEERVKAEGQGQILDIVTNLWYIKIICIENRRHLMWCRGKVSVQILTDRLNTTEKSIGPKLQLNLKMCLSRLLIVGEIGGGNTIGLEQCYKIFVNPGV